MHMRNIRLWITAAVIMLALICVGAASAEIIASGDCGKNGSNVTWTLDSEGVLSITGTGEMTGFSKYDGLSTSAPWDSCRNEIKSIIISDGVTSIGDYAFPYCGSLTSIVIPDSVTSIGNNSIFEAARIYCHADSYADTWAAENGRSGNVHYLEEITIILPENVFIGCGQETQMVCTIVPDGDYNVIWTSADPAIAAVSETGVITGASVGTTTITAAIENGASASCTVIVTPDTIIAAGNCGKIGGSVTWTLDSKGVLSITGTGAMKDYERYDLFTTAPWYNHQSEIKSVIIAGGVTGIGNNAFYGWGSLTGITIPDSVTSIGSSAIPSNALIYCYADTYAEAWAKENGRSDNVRYLSDAAIIASGDCGKNGSNVTWTLDSEGVLSITGTGAMKDYDYDEDYNYDYDLSAPTSPWKNYLRQIKSVKISNGVTRIGNGAFGGCSSMTSIEIPDSVTSIGNDAFCYCINLTNIALPGSVTSIGGNAFFCCGRLTSIAISDGVTEIGADAFYGCISLTNIVLPDSVTSIGDWAFGGCSGLTSIVIPAGVTSIGEGAIPDAALIYCDADSYAAEWAKNNGMGDNVRYLNGITIILPESILISLGKETPMEYTIASDGAYDVIWTSADPAIAAVSDNGVVTGASAGTTIITAAIENGAGASCTVTVAPEGIIAAGNCGKNGGNVTWTLDSEGVLSIAGTGAMKAFDYFYDYDNYEKSSTTAPWKNNLREIKSVSISNGVTNIGEDAFRNCSNLTSVSIPDSVTSIDSYAFSGCSSLTSIVIPDGVTSIGDDAFRSCSSLTSVVIPDSVTSIGFSAFNDCRSLTSIVLPNGVTSISFAAFCNCRSLTSVVIPASVTCIDDSAFENCSSLTSIAIPNGVTGIGYSAFSSCGSLTSIVIPDGVTYINDCAFENCSSLTSITIPNSVISIGEGAIPEAALIYCYADSYAEAWAKENDMGDNVRYLSDAAIIASGDCGAEGDNITWALDSEGVLTVTGAGAMADFDYQAPWYESAMDSSNPMGGPCKLTSAVIGEGITSIGSYAFSGFSSLKHIVLPDSIIGIGEYAFRECSELTEIAIPGGVTAIGSGAFVSCSALTEIIIPSGVTAIEDHTFEGCGGLTGITIPESVQRIGTSAFGYCSQLTEVILPEGISCIPEYAFDNCTALTSITIPESVISIEAQAFVCCSSLTEIIIPGSVEYIGDYAFDSCDALARISIPRGVQFIGECAIPEGTLIYCYADSYADGWAAKNGRSDNVRYLSDETGPESITLPEDISISLGEEKLVKRAIVPYGVYDARWTSADPAIAAVSENGTVTGVSEGTTTITLAHANGASDSCTVTVTPERIIATGDCGAEGDNLQWTLSSTGLLTIQGTGEMAEYEQNEEDYTSTMPWNSYRNSIKSVKISEGATTIGSYAFYGCRRLAEISMPATLSGIGDYAFSECRLLTGVSIPAGVRQISSGAFTGCESLTEIVIPEGITKIADYMFSDCDSLSNVVLPKGITSIGNYAFSGCARIESIVLPEGVTGVYSSAFARCEGLTDVTLPNSITEIVSDAFYSCTSLTEIVIPENVTFLGRDPFRNCSNLERITILSNVLVYNQFETFNVPGNTLLYCYAGSSAEEWIKANGLGDRIRYLIPEDAAIIRLPEGLTEICDEAYMNTAVEIVRLPENCVKIGARAFANCARLWRIEIPAMNIEIADDAFADSPNVVIYAPAGSAAQIYAEAHGIAYLEK